MSTANGQMPEKKLYLKQYTGIALGFAVLLLVSFILPTPAGMTPDAKRILGVVLCLLCLCDLFGGGALRLLSGLLCDLFLAAGLLSGGGLSF